MNPGQHTSTAPRQDILGAVSLLGFDSQDPFRVAIDFGRNGGPFSLPLVRVESQDEDSGAAERIAAVLLKGMNPGAADTSKLARLCMSKQPGRNGTSAAAHTVTAFFSAPLSAEAFKQDKSGEGVHLVDIRTINPGDLLPGHAIALKFYMDSLRRVEVEAEPRREPVLALGASFSTTARSLAELDCEHTTGGPIYLAEENNLICHKARGAVSSSLLFDVKTCATGCADKLLVGAMESVDDNPYPNVIRDFNADFWRTTSFVPHKTRVVQLTVFGTHDSSARENSRINCSKVWVLYDGEKSAFVHASDPYIEQALSKLELAKNDTPLTAALKYIFNEVYNASNEFVRQTYDAHIDRLASNLAFGREPLSSDEVDSIPGLFSNMEYMRKKNATIARDLGRLKEAAALGEYQLTDAEQKLLDITKGVADELCERLNTCMGTLTRVRADHDTQVNQERSYLAHLGAAAGIVTLPAVVLLGYAQILPNIDQPEVYLPAGLGFGASALLLARAAYKGWFRR